MNSYRESEPKATQSSVLAERRFSRRRLAISLLSPVSWCGLLPPTSPAAVARYDTIHDFVAMIAKRQRIASHLCKMNAPRVGNFWYIQRPGCAPEIFDGSVALQEGKAYGMYIDGPGDRGSIWTALQRIDPFFRDSAPNDWPRGRVLFNTALRHFEVDVTEELLAPQFIAEILHQFHLPERWTLFKADPHHSKTRFAFSAEGPREHA